jgi:hypothetical protein
MILEPELGMWTYKWMNMFMDESFNMDEWNSLIWIK